MLIPYVPFMLFENLCISFRQLKTLFCSSELWWRLSHLCCGAASLLFQRNHKHPCTMRVKIIRLNTTKERSIIAQIDGELECLKFSHNLTTTRF